MPKFFRITRKQREALFRVFQRDFPSWVSPARRLEGTPCPRCGYGGAAVKVPTTQWRKFRKQVHASFGCDGMVTIHWQGMWLAIETNGYTHS